MRKKVCIIHTGGTLGMGETSSGYGPVPGLLSKLMAAMPELRHEDLPSYEIHELNPLIDSSNMSPRRWFHIARDIGVRYDAFDGFVVLHGTDTMAYTASALPFMLKGLAKPVVLTGAQIPLFEVRNDARENLITSMLIAANYKIPEVMLFFGSRLLRGNRSVKVNATGFDAFSSPNFPPLGIAGISIDIRHDLLLPMPEKPGTVVVKDLSESRVAVLRLFPGLSADVVTNILCAPIKGLILETYGVGNAPDDDSALLSALHTAIERGVVIVNCTQCLQGRVQMNTYATGAALFRAGVISGLDMTTEAALAKMIYLFSRDLSAEQVKKQMLINMCGELTLKI